MNCRRNVTRNCIVLSAMLLISSAFCFPAPSTARVINNDILTIQIGQTENTPVVTSTLLAEGGQTILLNGDFEEQTIPISVVFAAEEIGQSEMKDAVEDNASNEAEVSVENTGENAAEHSRKAAVAVVSSNKERLQATVDAEEVVPLEGGNTINLTLKLMPEEIESAPETGDETTPGTEGETTPGTEGETTPGTEGETTPGTEGETSPGTDGETNPGTGGETTPGTEDETTPGTEEETIPGSEDESTPGTEGETTPGTEDETMPGGEDESTPGTESETTTGSEDESNPGAEDESVPGAEEETTPGGEDGDASGAEVVSATFSLLRTAASETSPKAEDEDTSATETETEAEGEAESDSETGTDTEGASGENSNTDAETTPETDEEATSGTAGENTTESTTENTTDNATDNVPEAEEELLSAEITLTYGEQILSATVVIIEENEENNPEAVGEPTFCPSQYHPTSPVQIINGQENDCVLSGFPAMAKYSLDEKTYLLYTGGSILIPAGKEVLVDFSLTEMAETSENADEETTEAAETDEVTADTAAMKDIPLTSAAGTAYMIKYTPMEQIPTEAYPLIAGAEGVTLPVSYTWGAIAPNIKVEYLAARTETEEATEESEATASDEAKEEDNASEEEESEALIWKETAAEMIKADDTGRIQIMPDRTAEGKNRAAAGTYRATVSWIENEITVYQLEIPFFIQYKNGDLGGAQQ